MTALLDEPVLTIGEEVYTEPVQSMMQDYVNRLQGPDTDIRFHLPYLFKTALRYPDMQVLELGVRDCNSTTAFLAAAEAVGGVVFSVDLVLPEAPDDILARWAASKKWEFLKAHSLSVTSKSPFDLIFLDTSHDLYETMAELRKFWQMLKPGGRLLCHDTEWVGLDDPSAKYMVGKDHGWGPVAWALDWFCREHGEENLSWINHPGSFGLGELRKP
jgi:hypothetical protein